MRLSRVEQGGPLSNDEKYCISPEYKKQVLKAMSSDQLVDIALTNPTVTLIPSYRDTGFTATYEFKPLTNIVFTRDQQITTRRGIVMGRLRSAQRAAENKLMKFCWMKLGLPVIGSIKEPGYLEGRNFLHRLSA